MTNLILELKKRYNYNQTLLENDKLQEGYKLKLLTGSFADLVVTVENTEGNNRIWVLLEHVKGTIKLNFERTLTKNYYKF